MTMRIVSRLALITAAAAPGAAHAADCASYSHTGSLGAAIPSVTVSVGDVVTIDYPGTIGGESMTVSGAAAQVIAFPATPSIETVVATADGAMNFIGTGTTVVTMGCEVGFDDTVDLIEDAAASSVAQGTIVATVGLITGRVGTALASPPAASAGGATGSGPAPAGGEAGGEIEGGAGQGADRPWGVWANVGWNGISNSERVSRSDTDVITGVVGADTIYDDGVLLGLAVVLSHAMVDTPTDTFSLRETSVTFAPYAAYAISEDISVDASFGYGVGVSRVEKTQGTITGDGVNHRYFLSANGTYRNYWGDFGFTGKTGVLWAQNFQGAYDNSDGTRTGSSRSDMLSFDLEAKPSYIFYFDDFALEPYIGVDYTYDAYMTDVRGTANDPDQMTFLAGLSLFAGSIYGSIDFERAFFRENQDRTAVSGTLRIQF